MLPNNSSNAPHPHEALSAYVLGALDEPEASQVEAHVEACALCQSMAAELTPAAEALSRLAPPVNAPRLPAAWLNNLPPQTAAPAQRGNSGRLYRRLSTMMLPLAAAIVLGLFSAGLLFNLRLSARLERMEQENNGLASRMALVEIQSGKAQDSVGQLRAVNYLMAEPGGTRLALLSPTGSSSPQGILLVSSDGRRAALLVAGLEPLPPDTAYQVWLMRPGSREQAGTLTVDKNGWGTLTLLPPEPVYGYDWVGVAPDTSASDTLASSDMLMRASISR